MPEFKVGDKVKCVDNTFTALKCDVIYTVDAANLGYVELKDRQEGWLCASRFEKADLSLEDQLEAAKEQLVVANDSVHSLEQRIKFLQQAIKERDKPSGRVGIKDSLAGVEVLWLAHCNGGVYKKSHLWATQRPNYIRMGVVFYDHQSAERYVHDRKQAVLRGDV